jgi:hypothetical protein
MDPMTTPSSTTVPSRIVAPSPSLGLAALSGAVAAAVALAVSELLAGLLPGAVSLVAAIGGAVIDLQPPGAKDVVVALFGTNDKLALEIVVVLAALGFGAGLGVLAVRSYLAAAVGFAAFGVLGFVAAVDDPLAGPVMLAAQVALAVGAGLQTLSWGLTRRARVDGAVGTPAAAEGRRSFLVALGGLAVAAGLGGLTGRWLI